MSASTRIALALVVLGATACAPETPQAPQDPEPSRTSTPVPASTPSVTTASPIPSVSPIPSASDSPTRSSAPSPSGRVVRTSFGAALDPSKCTASSEHWRGNRRFYLNGEASQEGCFTSPWFGGSHPVMLSYGRTVAPWYASHVHHGVDVDMPEGTPVRSGVAGTVHVRPSTMGASYGSKRLLVRSDGRDHVIGHLGELAVADGQRVQPGDLLGRSGTNGCEQQDGPHLHFEVRPSGTGYQSAVDPWESLRMSRA